MAAFVAKQMVGNKLNAVKGESTRLSTFYFCFIIDFYTYWLDQHHKQNRFVYKRENTMNNDDSFFIIIIVDTY